MTRDTSTTTTGRDGRKRAIRRFVHRRQHGDSIPEGFRAEWTLGLTGDVRRDERCRPVGPLRPWPR